MALSVIFGRPYTGVVNTYADLPSPEGRNNQLWLVKTSTGIIMINYHPSGTYYSDGTAWFHVGGLDDLDMLGDLAFLDTITVSYITDFTTSVLAIAQPLDAALTSVSGIPWTQGDMLYFTGVDTAARLVKDANATRYITNQGSGNGPAWGQVNLANGVTGDLPFANLTQGSALSVLGVTGNATADVASIQGTADQTLVVNSAGTALTFGALNLAAGAAVTGLLPIANIDSGFVKVDGSTPLSADWRVGDDNISLVFGTGSDAEAYYDGTNFILDASLVGTGVVSIGPTTTTTSATGVSQTGASKNFLWSRAAMGGSPINTFFWINYDLETTQGRGSMNFVQKYIGSGSIQANINSDARYFGTSNGPLNLSAWFAAYLGVNNSGTSTTGFRSYVHVDSSIAFSQGTHNMFCIECDSTSVGGTHTAGTINRYGVKQNQFTAFTLSGATATDWGAFFGNDVAIRNNTKLIMEGTLTAKGDSYTVFNSATTDWDFFVDNVKVMTLDDDAIDFFVDTRYPDNIGTQYGTGVDAEITYDGTDLIINPKLVGTGIVKIAGVEGVLAGASTAYAKVGGTIFDHFADVGNVGTGEDDLYSDTIAASALNTDGDKICAEYTIVLASSATATRTVKAYFGGTQVLTSGALTFASGGTAAVYVTVIRESSTVVRVMAEFVPTGITLQPIVTYTRITGLTLTNTQIIKITGEAAGAGAATDDLIAKLGYVEWKSAA